jgi:succinyl-diaminopimelate desuccinylase
MSADEKKKFLKDLKKFVSFKTETGNYTQIFEDCFDWIKTFFKGLSVEFLTVESGGFKSLIIKPENSKKPKVLGLGHIDVVPAEDEQYKMTEKDGWIYGRGVADMKLQNLVMIYSFLKLEKRGEGHNFWLALTSDEEVGGFNGGGAVARLLQENNQEPEIVFAPDGGHNFNFQETEKGVAHFKVTAGGRSAHGSRPWLGDNALMKIIRFAMHMNELFPTPKDEQDWKPTFSFNKIISGSAANKIPDYAEALFDGRLTEIFTIKSFEDYVLKEASKFGVEAQLIAAGDVMHSPSKHPIAKDFMRIIESVTKTKPKPNKSSGASDARFFTHLGSIILMTNPVVTSLHETREATSTESVWMLQDIADQMIKKYACQAKESSLMERSVGDIIPVVQNNHPLMIKRSSKLA